jgi:hypothetical protein
MEADGDFQGNAQAKANENNSALTVTNSKGEHSHNGPNIINEEVNQEQGNLNLVNPLELELLEAPLNIEDLAPDNGPVIVQGQEQALNMDNFMNFGIGVQNLMMAYHDIDPDSDSEQSSENSPMHEDASPIGNQEQDMEFFHFNEVPAEVAHLQIGMVETFLFPLEDKNKFSEEAIKLWDQYFAPHIQRTSGDNELKVLEIPVGWFNFITLMLLTPEKFDWTIFFLNSALWKLLLDNESKEDTISFIIPDKCSVTQAPTCKLAELDNADELIDEGIPQATPSAPKRKRRGKGPLVESEVRRSPRIVELNAGYKQHSSCSDRNCLSCLASPPVTKHKIVKKILLPPFAR